MRTKRRSTRPVRLPRLTLLAYSKRDLAAFLEACNTLSFRVQDLKVLVDRLSVEIVCLAAKREKKKKPGPDQAGAEAPGG